MERVGELAEYGYLTEELVQSIIDNPCDIVPLKLPPPAPSSDSLESLLKKLMAKLSALGLGRITITIEKPAT